LFPFLNYNGKIIPANQPAFHSGNRSLRYGDGLFESLHLMDGEILFFEDHFDRLMEGMKVLGITKTIDFDSAYFYKHICNLFIANKIQEDVMIRVQVFRTNGGLYEPLSDKAEFFIELTPVPADSFSWNENGITAGIFREWEKQMNPAMNYKTSNSLVYVMAARWKRDMKLDDAVVLNTRGHICDATSSNIFLIKGSKILTPSLEEGGVGGVVRKNLIQLINRKSIKDITEPVEERTVKEEELFAADEVFLTNSSRGIRWIKSIGEKQFESNLTRKIAEEFYSYLKHTHEE